MAQVVFRSLLEDRVPKFAYVAGVDKHIVGKRQKSEALSWPYVQINLKERIFNIILDLDCDSAISDWYDALPIEPAYFAGRKRNGQIVRPHAVIKLKIPVDVSKWKQMFLLVAIRNHIQERLELEGCKVDPKQPITTKNPACSETWSVKPGDDRLWTLNELRDALHMPKPDEIDDCDLVSARRFMHSYDKYFDEETAAHGRNCELFEAMKRPAYTNKSRMLNEAELIDYIFVEASEYNAQEFPDNPLPTSEIRSVARSVGQWTWNTYQGQGHESIVDRGACRHEIQNEMDLKTRQAVGGRYAASKVSLSHFRAILEAIKDKDGYTVSGLSSELKMSRNTIRKYLTQAEETLANANAPKDALETKHEVVKPVLSGIGHLIGTQEQEKIHLDSIDSIQESKISFPEDNKIVSLKSKNIESENKDEGVERTGLEGRALRDDLPAQAGSSRPIPDHQYRNKTIVDLTSVLKRRKAIAAQQRRIRDEDQKKESLEWTERRRQSGAHSIPWDHKTDFTQSELASYKSILSGNVKLYRDPIHPETKAISESGIVVRLSDVEKYPENLSDLPHAHNLLLKKAGILKSQRRGFYRIPDFIMADKMDLKSSEVAA